MKRNQQKAPRTHGKLDKNAELWLKNIERKKPLRTQRFMKAMRNQKKGRSLMGKS